jgi:hypothetical protein
MTGWAAMRKDIPPAGLRVDGAHLARDDRAKHAGGASSAAIISAEESGRFGTARADVAWDRNHRRKRSLHSHDDTAIVEAIAAICDEFESYGRLRFRSDTGPGQVETIMLRAAIEIEN